MKICATLKNVITPEDKGLITRNLHRIMDIVILDIDSENSTITFLYASKRALDTAIKELNCIGFPMISIQTQKCKEPNRDVTDMLV